MQSLYYNFNVSPSNEAKLRQNLKNILGATPPNITTLNKKAALNEPRYFQCGANNYMIICSNLEVKKQKIDGQPGILYLLFKLDSNAKYTYQSHYIVLDWYNLYKKLIKEYSLTLDYFMKIEVAATLAEQRLTTEESAVTLEQVEAASKILTDLPVEENNTEEVCETDSVAAEAIQTEESSLHKTCEEHKDEIDALTLDLSSSTDCTETTCLEDDEPAEEATTATNDSEMTMLEQKDNMADSSSDNEGTYISTELLKDTINELPQGTDVSSFMSNIMTTFTADNMLPPISVFYACVKQNSIDIEVGLFKRLISRILFIEWTSWLYEKITTTGQLTHTEKFLIDTGFSRADGQPLYSIVDVIDNYPRYIKLDCSLVDIKAAGLDKSAARNQLRNCRDRLRDNPLTLDSIDFSSNAWKVHILQARQYRFGPYKNLDSDTRMNMVLNSIKYACLHEDRGSSLKRMVRGSNTHVSVAIPLIYKNNRKSSTAIILALNKFGVWEISTIETGRDLINNLRAYNYYDMPSWLNEQVDVTK